MYELLSQSAPIVAPQLLGWRLMMNQNGKQIGGIIVETEAYDQSDAASHSYKGKTTRTKVMFGPAGYAYVYFTYGMHYCMNVVTGKKGEGSAVLIRALEPTSGIEKMKGNRKQNNEYQLTNGPAKLCQALGINQIFNGHNLAEEPLRLIPPNYKVLTSDIATGSRIGISKDTHRQWRFFIKNNAYISR